MTAYHTQMLRSTYTVADAEIANITVGDGEALARVDGDISQLVASLSRSGRTVPYRLLPERQTLWDTLLPIADSMVAGCDEDEFADAIRGAADGISGLVDSVMASHADYSAVLEMAVAQVGAAAETEDVKRFVPEQVLELQTRLAALRGSSLASEADRHELRGIVKDILMMDLVMFRNRAIFDRACVGLQTIGLSLMAKLDNAKANNFAVIGDASTERLDLDFWADGAFSRMRDALQRALAKASDKKTRLYGIETATDIVRRLDSELPQIIRTARETYNHALNRKILAQTCCDIITHECDYRIVGDGYDRGDRLGPYLARLKHPAGAQVEVIVDHGDIDGEYALYFRLDAASLRNQAVAHAINESIPADFEKAGATAHLFAYPFAEDLEPFDPDNVRVSDDARRVHGISPARDIDKII